ncbi:DUF4870 domain-containing protein [Glaciihabitans sp. dw_435]|uniref:DUF4870 domain-containing protein n=1 Tax=Glaciihabitans sp. dw_435 TaxID=2720081 RepID=UPI001BD260CA|nr:DUF4870 domain-containing protein [Glaciihabitans sp. dw_435]
MTESNPHPASAPGAPLSPAEDRQWASFAHFGNIIPLIPALVIYLVFKDRGTLTRQESKEALNWTINVVGIIIAGNIVATILGFIPIIGIIVGLLIGLIIWVVYVLNLVFAIMGGVKVNGGGSYRYPFNIRWIK